MYPQRRRQPAPPRSDPPLPAPTRSDPATATNGTSRLADGRHYRLWLPICRRQPAAPVPLLASTDLSRDPSLKKWTIFQELCESRGGGRPGLSVLTSLVVSVDVKLY